MKHIIIAVALSLFSATVSAQSPNDVIEEAVAEIAVKIHGRKEELAADTDALYALIDSVLLPRFDRRYAASRVLAKHWRTASDEQKDAFEDAFYASLLRKYADGIVRFDEDKIEVLPYRGDDTKSHAVVKTKVMLGDGTVVPVNYGMIKRKSDWLMFDVAIEGISYVRNFRVELNSEIQNSSLDAVIARLQNDVKEPEEPEEPEEQEPEEAKEPDGA